MNHHILIVESDPLAGQLKDVLLRNGYQVEIQKNGRDALWYLDQNPISVMICGIDLLYLDGINLWKGLKSHPDQAQLHVIFWVDTCRESQRLEIQALGSGVLGIFEKQQGIKSILSEIRNFYQQQIDQSETIL
jgi:DNA-binding response OmpR family regulator